MSIVKAAKHCCAAKRRNPVMLAPEKGKYVVAVYGDDEIAPVRILKGCEIILKDIFRDLPE